MYAAKTYIGQVAAPGEILPDSIPEETIQWLKEAGAIREIAPNPSPRGAVPDGPDKPRGGEPEQSAPQEGEPSGEDAQDMEAVHEEQDEPDEEAPEIDVMAGIVTGSAEEKTTEKRMSGRRKTR